VINQPDNTQDSDINVGMSAQGLDEILADLYEYTGDKDQALWNNTLRDKQRDILKQHGWKEGK